MSYLEDRTNASPIPYDTLSSQRGFFDFRILTIPLIIAGVVFVGFLEGRRVEDNKLVMQEVYSLASGSDSVLSLDESVRMARGLGYYGELDTQYPISFKADKGLAGSGLFLVNGPRTIPLKREDVANYVKLSGSTDVNQLLDGYRDL